MSELTAPAIRTVIDRSAAVYAEEFASLGVATVHESQARSGLLHPTVHPIAEGQRAAGTAVTCLNHPGDNLMLLAALEQCQAGDILVVGHLGPSSAGVVGEIIASILLSKQVAGLVVDGGVRDTRELRKLGLPVWSTAISAAGTTKSGAGWVNFPIVAAGALVNPGDVVVADDDGVVVVPKTEAAEVLTRAKTRFEREAAMLADLAENGWAGLSEDLRAQLAALGVRYVESPDR